MPLTDKDLHFVRKLYNKLRHFEDSFHQKNSEPIILSEEIVSLLNHFFIEAQSHKKMEVQKLSQLSRVVKLSMTPTEWHSLIIPIERILQNSITDSEIFISQTDKLTQFENSKKYPLVLVLDNFRSAFNVGSLFRAAECFGVDKIILCGLTPTPDHLKVAKAALGSEKMIQWETTTSTLETVKRLAESMHVVALETSSNARSMSHTFPHQPSAFILGNERFGLSKEVLTSCHETRIIDLYGQKNSLNVAQATTVALYEWTQQWNNVK